MIDSTTNLFLSAKELSKYLNISLSSVYRLVNGRSLQFYKIGGNLRFKKEDVDNYLKQVVVETLK